MPEESPTLQPAHRKLLQLVYDRFQQTGAWPSGRSVRLAIRQDGELTELCRELGSRLIFCVIGDAPTGACELRVQPLLRVAGAAPAKALMATAVQYVGKRPLPEIDSR